MPKTLPLMPGVRLVNSTRQRLYVRGRTISTVQGPIKIFIVAQDPGAFTVAGDFDDDDDYEIGIPSWLRSVASTALNVASAAGIPGAGAIKSVAEATGILKGKAKAAPKAAPRAVAAKAARAAAAPRRALAARRSAVRHLPKGAKIPKKFVEVIPVAPSTEGAGFID